MWTTPLDASEHNSRDGGPSFAFRVRLVRLIWMIVWFLFASWTPRHLAFWRRALLRFFGAKIGTGSDVRGSAKVWFPPNLIMADRAVLAGGVNCYNQALVTVESGAIVSQGAYLCCGTHNIDDELFQLEVRPITIGKNSWIASEAFVGPGVTVGEGAVLAARGAAFSDLQEWTVYRGNPAVSVKKRRKFG